MIASITSNKKQMASMIPSDSYIRIYGFMRTDMNLEKTELLVYALIYSYFRNCLSFSASREYISEWVGSGKNAVSDALASLIRKGYITKSPRLECGLRYTEYNINVDALPPSCEHSYMLNLHKEEARKCRNI